MTETPLYGLMAEFDNPTELMKAARATYAAGYRNIDAYTPYPIEELADVIGFKKTRVPLVCLLGGILGGLSGYLLQYWINNVSYPLNIGGRPSHSWPAFIIVTFEMTILFGGLSAVIGMLGLNGLPAPYHPVFNNPRFSAVSRDRFFLCIEAADPQFDPERARQFLSAFNTVDIAEVLE
ncbi:MAG: DUF3341 domain-containing protein [Candidatus Korobacteraceae bacterium]|jgi:hypothetical protein